MGKPDRKTTELMTRFGLAWTDAVASSKVIAFRRFRIVPTTRQLLCNGVEVEISSRAFDLLLMLLGARGRIVEKAQIMECVWPSTFVHENNLRVQMAGLRRALGKDRDAIKTIPGRGYMLTEDIPDRATLLNASGLPTDSPLSTPISVPERIRILDHENSMLRQAISRLTNGLSWSEQIQNSMPIDITGRTLNRC